ncbi:MAG: hypothetical protein Q4F41_19500 [Eubacteriales bacterium]|nr:hypothetical protein [Eubacteriales bacterium]
MKSKRKIFVSALCALLIGSAALPACAYTEEEKQMVKDALSAYGYAPNWDGLNQAYEDYLAGRLDLSAYGIAPVQQYDEPQVEPYDEPQTEPATDQGGTSGTASETPGDGDGAASETPGNGDGAGDENPGSGSSVSENVPETEAASTEAAEPLELGKKLVAADYAEITLKEIAFGKRVYPPVTNGTYQNYICHSEQMQYLDLVFQVKNLTKESILPGDFLSITVNVDGREYPGEMNLCEIGNGTDLSADTPLYAMMEGKLHCVAAVPEDAQSFIVTISINGQTETVVFEKGDPLLETEELLLETPVLAENLAEVTLKGVEMAELDGETYVKAALEIRNLQAYESEISWMLGGSYWDGESRYPGYISLEEDGSMLPEGAGIKADETLLAYLMIPLTEETEAAETESERETESESGSDFENETESVNETEEDTEVSEPEKALRLYLNGTWYSYEME